MVNAVSGPSVSAVVACYLDNQAIPEMYSRLSKVFEQLGCDYEIIFVNDGSPDESGETAADISRLDPNVICINHSRNFGSQMAFLSGMKVASKDSVVLLDGDLQDPPEVIPRLYSKMLEGFDVVYGVRTKREMPFLRELTYKLFYKFYSQLADFKVPRDAGDFSIISRKVVEQLVTFGERDLFLRGLRAYVGFKQVGVPYNRPERKYGTSTNDLKKNLLWARLAIFSSSARPLTFLTELGFSIFVGSLGLAIALGLARIFSSSNAVPGVTMLALLVVFFGGMQIFAIGILGEYLAKVLQEVKARPAPIVESIIGRGINKTNPLD